jgi:hypothetical protein
VDRRHAVAAAAVVALLLGGAGVARAESFVRVLTQQASVRTGPSADYRQIYTAERGEVLQVVERGTRGYWFKVELDDGSSGWIFGEQVSPFEVDDGEPGFFTRTWRGFRKAVLGPTPVPYSDVGLAFSAGVIGNEGLFLFRPSWLVDPYFAIEAFGGESPRGQETLYLAGLGMTLRLAPGAAVGPYVNAGAGISHFSPKEDAFALDPRTLYAVSVGGGLEVTIRLRLTLRFDFRNWTIFDENEASNAQEYSGGMVIFF